MIIYAFEPVWGLPQPPCRAGAAEPTAELPPGRGLAKMMPADGSRRLFEQARPGEFAPQAAAHLLAQDQNGGIGDGIKDADPGGAAGQDAGLG